MMKKENSPEKEKSFQSSLRAFLILDINNNERIGLFRGLQII